MPTLQKSRSEAITSEMRQGDLWEQRSLYDLAMQPQEGESCPSPADLERLRSHACDNLEDESRLPERGFFIARGVAPLEETTAMFDFVQGLNDPLRLLCGASDVQPKECMFHGGELKRRFPKAFGFVYDLFARWIESGMNEEAALGWPLEISGSEFISINAWRFARNSSCLFSSLFDAAAPFAAQCLDVHGCGEGGTEVSLSKCWMGCIFEAIITKMPRVEVLAALDETTLETACQPTKYDLLDGPFDYIMGGDGFWDFGPKAKGGWGNQRLISNLRAWLTNMSNTTTYQGYHDWHTDGPAVDGRYHKIFYMVNKSSAPGDRRRTNIKLIPADVLYAHKCEFESTQQAGSPGRDAWSRIHRDDDLGHPAPTADPDDAQLKKASMKQRALGFRNGWNDLESLGCVVDLDPGDLVFFREDVWHRTQDMLLDRVGLILDIFRWPVGRPFAD